MSEVNYWICQTIPDVFRNEPRNVGVIVQKGEEKFSRFFGEKPDQQIDGRRISSWPFPDVYRQWVDYWRREIPRQDIDVLALTGKSNYRIVKGGIVSDVGSDSIDAVAAYLYSLLVEGGFSEAISEEAMDADRAKVALVKEIESDLKNLHIFNDGSASNVRHPIRKNAPIQGLKVPEYRPEFSQDNGALYIIETADFLTTQKKRIRDRAGYFACMFRDIREAHQNVKPITIVKVEDQDRDDSDVRDALSFLNSEGEVVNWLNDGERKKFLLEREIVANQI
jgi:hypothetical protein